MKEQFWIRKETLNPSSWGARRERGVHAAFQRLGRMAGRQRDARQVGSEEPHEALGQSGPCAFESSGPNCWGCREAPPPTAATCMAVPPAFLQSPTSSWHTPSP